MAIEAPGRRPLDVAVDLSPSALNRSSRGRWVTAMLQPLPPESASAIDPGSIVLNGSVSIDPSAPVTIGDVNRDGVADLSVKFRRSDVVDALPAGPTAAVTLSGLLNGRSFEGADSVRVLADHADAQAAVAEDLVSAKPRLEIGALAPSPASSRNVTVSVSLASEEPARLEVIDVVGRIAAVRDLGALGAGWHELPMSFSPRLHSGVYFLRLSQSGLRATRRIVVLD